MDKLVEVFKEPEDFREAAEEPIHWNYYIKKVEYRYKLLVRFTSYRTLLSGNGHILRCDVELGDEPSFAAESDNKRTIEAFRDKAEAYAEELFPDATNGEWKYE